MRLKSTYQIINNITGEAFEGTIPELAEIFGVSQKRIYNAHLRDDEMFKDYTIFRKKPVYYLIMNNKIVDSNTNMQMLCLLNNHDYGWARRHLMNKEYKGERIAISYEYD